MEKFNDMVLISKDKSFQQRSKINKQITFFTRFSDAKDASILFYHLPLDESLEETRSSLVKTNASRIVLIVEHQDLSAVFPYLVLLPVHGIVQLNRFSEEIADVLKVINKGYFYLNTALHTKLVNQLHELQDSKRPIRRFSINPVNCTGLNKTEQFVLEKLANGNSPAAIAKEKNCSIATVYLASTRLSKFFNVKDRTDAVVTAIRSNCLIPEKV